ncbi:hypothetical protein HC928_08605 [bacterium]|nr:hypothetical protein [bacterium]
MKNPSTQEKTGEVVGKELRCSEKTKNIILGGRIYNCEGRIQEVKGTITISASTEEWDALTTFDTQKVEYHLKFSLTVSEGQGMIRFKFAKDSQMIEQHISPDRPFDFEGLVIARYQVHESLPIQLSTETTLKGIQYSSVLQTT